MIVLSRNIEGRVPPGVGKMDVGFWQRDSRSGRAISCLLAAGLSALCTIVTYRIAALHAGLYALHFILMVCVAVLAGLWPSLSYILFAVLSMHYLAPQPVSWLPFTSIDVVRPGTLTVSAILLNWMLDKRRQTAVQLEAALATLQTQTAALIESQQASKCASWHYDRHDRTRWFPGGYEVFGMPFVQLEQHPSPIDLILPEDQPAVREAVGRMLSTRGSLRVEYRTVWPNGELHWSEARGNPVPDDPNLWRGVTFDITERKLAETALIQNEKLAAVGRLASTVAHEINNPLEAVTNLLYLARRGASIDPETEEHLALAEKELARLGNITRLTLGFVRNSPVHSEVNLCDVVNEVLSIYHHRLEMKNIRVERSCQSSVCISIVPHELRQIAVNLISNAADALSRPDARIFVSIQQLGSTAVLSVADNGSGITGPVLQRIFEPFFTTKADVGTGIGLWITRELVEKHGGSISVRSGDLPGGLATEFRVEFPASNGRSYLPPQPEPQTDAISEPIFPAYSRSVQAKASFGGSQSRPA